MDHARPVSEPDILLVIGAHREELAFGDRVAETLEVLSDIPPFSVLRIPEGLSGRHPRSDEVYRTDVQHRELYHQIKAEVGSRRLVIDLHRGFDDHGPCADIFSGDDQLLRTIQNQIDDQGTDTKARALSSVRCIQIDHSERNQDRAMISAYTRIPREVWDAPSFRFVGLEVYIPTSDDGRQTDWVFAADLLKTIMQTV